MICNHNCQWENGNPSIRLEVIFTAEMMTGETKGSNKIGSSTSLNLALIANPETKLPIAMIAKLTKKVTPKARSIFSGGDSRRKRKNGRTTRSSVTEINTVPAPHFERKINPRSTGEVINKVNASNSFS